MPPPAAATVVHIPVDDATTCCTAARAETPPAAVPVWVQRVIGGVDPTDLQAAVVVWEWYYPE